jgi:hypothetical protein
MAYGEGMARSWLETHREGSLYYAATPVYVGDELLARAVIVDIRTDDGSVDQRIMVYNAAKGFELDYATGDFRIVPDTAGDERKTHDEGTPAQTSASGEDAERRVIVTGSGRAYHHDESCRGLAQAKSMRWVSVAEAEQMGRHPCGICGG